jgi:hypothetical protein
MSPINAPFARVGPGTAFDATAGNVVLFGGNSSSGTYYNDTWTWDGINWTQQLPVFISVRPQYYEDIRRSDWERLAVWCELFQKLFPTAS